MSALRSGFSQAAPSGSGTGAGAGPAPTAARSPASPEHVLRAPDLHRRQPPAAGRGLRAPGCSTPRARLPVRRGRGARGHRPPSRHVTWLPAATKNRDAGQCGRSGDLRWDARACCKCVGWGAALSLIVGVVQVLPKPVPTRPVSTVGK